MVVTVRSHVAKIAIFPPKIDVSSDVYEGKTKW